VRIKDKAAGAVTLLELSGKIMGGDDYDVFQSKVKSLVAEGKVDVLLDMSGVDWVNSTGLGILVTGYTTLRKNNGRMKICCVSRRVDDILIVSGLKKVFEVFDKREEALASFGPAPAAG